MNKFWLHPHGLPGSPCGLEWYPTFAVDTETNAEDLRRVGTGRTGLLGGWRAGGGTGQGLPQCVPSRTENAPTPTAPLLNDRLCQTESKFDLGPACPAASLVPLYSVHRDPKTMSPNRQWALPCCGALRLAPSALAARCEGLCTWEGRVWRRIVASRAGGGGVVARAPFSPFGIPCVVAVAIVRAWVSGMVLQARSETIKCHEKWEPRLFAEQSVCEADSVPLLCPIGL